MDTSGLARSSKNEFAGATEEKVRWPERPVHRVQHAQGSTFDQCLNKKRAGTQPTGLPTTCFSNIE
jgi:hypothetical protein